MVGFYFTSIWGLLFILVREIVQRYWLLVSDREILGLSSLTANIEPNGSILLVRVDLGYSLVWFFWQPESSGSIHNSFSVQRAWCCKYSLNHSGLLIKCIHSHNRFYA